MELNINFSLLFAVLAVDLLAMAGDSTMTWTSPMYPKLYSSDKDINPLGKPITKDQDGWIGSLINIGAMIGPFIFVYIAEKFGRKIGLLCIAIPHLTSFLTLAFARVVPLYYFARFFGGLSEGAGYSLMPMYIAEVTQDSNRGMFSVTLNCFWTFGNLIPYMVGPFVSAMWLNLILACLPAIFFVTFLFVAPETPYYLMKMGKMEKAEHSLRSLRNVKNDEAIKKELEHIKSTVDHEEHGKITDIFKSKPLQKALLISISLVVIQQLSGINALLFYMQVIFKASGSTIPDDISCIIFGCMLFASSFVAPFLTDRWGRKNLLILSCFGSFIALAFLGAFFYILDNTDIDTKPFGWLPIASLIGYIIFFNFGIGPLPWTVSAELFPSSVKSSAASIISSSCWLTSFILTKCFNDMTVTLTNAGSFWFFSGCCVLGGLFCMYFVPETKGKSFLEIQKMLAA